LPLIGLYLVPARNALLRVTADGGILASLQARALEPSEEQAILEAAARNQSRLIYPFLFTLAWTGMRSDEARTLRWSQVDLGEAGEIRVGGPKTEAGKGRRIPLTGNLKAVLIQYAARYSSQLAQRVRCLISWDT